MPFDFDALFAGMVDRGELRIEPLPDGSPTYRQTARGAEVYREGMQRIASGEDLLMQLECSLVGLDTDWPFPHEEGEPSGLTTNPDCDGHSTDQRIAIPQLFSASGIGATNRQAARPSVLQRASKFYHDL